MTPTIKRVIEKEWGLTQQDAVPVPILLALTNGLEEDLKFFGAERPA